MVTKVGGDISEYLPGSDSDDYLYGLGGDDTLDGFNGQDSLFGGNGNDYVYGGRNNDFLYGEAGNDHLYGQEDNDTLVGGYMGAGDDVLDGGSGYDTADYSGTVPVTVDLDKGTATAYEYGTDTLYGMDNIIGSSATDILIGNNAGFLGIGGFGINVINGGGGRDTIYGRSGDDTLYGGTGLYHDDLFGEDGNDTLYGEDAPDFLNGGNGDDYLYGGAHNDTLVGGAGNDYLDGGDGIDTVSFANATGAVKMYPEDVGGMHGAEGTDSFFNIENISGSQYGDFLSGAYLGQNTANFIDGGAGNDVVDGAGGNDTLVGGIGDDHVSGGMGVDKLTGGLGLDTFDFGDLQTFSDAGVGVGNRDVVFDFVQGQDHLRFYGDAMQDVSGTQSTFAFVGISDFSNEGQLRVSYEGTNTIVQGNTDLDATPEFEIQIAGHFTMGSTDFVFA
jgi:Ca2+-binding RTX toxin-like protein